LRRPAEGGSRLSEDCTFYGNDQTHHGVPALQQYFAGIRAQMPDLRHEVTSTIEADGALALEVLASGSMLVNGREVSVEIRACDFLWVLDGKIVKWHAYTDTVGLQRQLGDALGSALGEALSDG
jgi:predicted ester cyclase